MIDLLLDEGSQSRFSDGYFGTVDGRPVCVLYKEGVFNGCSCDVVDLALKVGVPIVNVFNCKDFEITMKTLLDTSKFLEKMGLANGVIPRITVFLSKAHWLLCYQTDFVGMVENVEYSVVMPEIIKSFTGKEVEISAEFHAKSGNCHFMGESDEVVLSYVRKLLSFLPLNNMEDPPLAETRDDVRRTIDFEIPADSYQPFDMRALIAQVLDDEDFFEIQSNYAQNVITGFGRLDGMSVGIVANDPAYNLGCLDVDGIKKITSFVRFCDAFNIPIVNFVDTPGFLPDFDQEIGGLAKYMSRLVDVYSQATTPIVSVVVRKAYSSFVVMGLTGSDVIFAYPNAEFAVVDADTDSNKLGKERWVYVREFREEAFKTFVNEVIDVKWTRAKLINTLRLLETKRKKLPPKKCDVI
ncbi:carboxyl transferase domain-containing protein [Archaeoglobus sp.]